MTESAELGYIEGVQRLEKPGRRWNDRELLDAARSAALRNTGWPLGLVLDRDGLRPVPVEGGIEARLPHKRLFSESGPEWEDYWFFANDGRYFVTRVFEEDVDEPSFRTSEGHPDKALWFDIRIWRAAELVLHSAILYEHLGIAPDEQYTLGVRHTGLAGREFWASSAGYGVRRGRKCSVAETTWQRPVTIDYVKTSLNDLVEEMLADLFLKFDFSQVPRTSIDTTIAAFRAREL